MKNDRFKVPVIVDDDRKYETPGFLTKILRIPLIIVLNLLPKNLAQKVFLFQCEPNGNRRIIFDNIATYRALEVLYTFPERKAKKETTPFDNFWDRILNNVRAVRNRLRLVERLITDAIDEKIKEGKQEIKLLSLGSGSARAVIESIAPFNGKVKLNVGLIDLSREAINFSRKLAKEHNLDGLITYHRDYAQNLEKYYKNADLDIIEMVGLLDYYPDLHAINLISKIYKVLSPGGWLITCNISPNFESPFITKGINWVLIYRTPEEITKILVKGGFSPSNINLVCEPLRIHTIAIAKKDLS
jgi:SAM-dependent methyltransferase